MKQLSIILGLSLIITLGTFTDIQAHSAIDPISETVEMARSKVVKFKVYGNCGMCKTKIEGALKGVKGVRFAIWDVKKKMITVKYNPKKIDLITLHKKIAAVGYDTDKVKAKDEVYNGLHHCCKYDRPAKS